MGTLPSLRKNTSWANRLAHCIIEHALAKSGSRILLTVNGRNHMLCVSYCKGSERLTEEETYFSDDKLNIEILNLLLTAAEIADNEEAIGTRRCGEFCLSGRTPIIQCQFVRIGADRKVELLFQ